MQSNQAIAQSAPLWQRALPFVVLAPTAAMTNGSLGSFAIVVLCLIFVRSSRGPTLAFKVTDWPRWAMIGIAVGIAMFLVSHFWMDPLLERSFGKIDLGGYENVKGNLGGFLALMALALIYGGLVEELVFRGFVIGYGTNLLGERAAIPMMVLSTIVFGAAHGYYQGAAGAISTGVFGLCMGILYLASGRKLLPAIVAHVVNDAIGVVALYLGYGG